MNTFLCLMYFSQKCICVRFWLATENKHMTVTWWWRSSSTRIVKGPNLKKCIIKGDNLCVTGPNETMSRNVYWPAFFRTDGNHFSIYGNCYIESDNLAIISVLMVSIHIPIDRQKPGCNVSETLVYITINTEVIPIGSQKSRPVHITVHYGTI